MDLCYSLKYMYRDVGQSLVALNIFEFDKHKYDFDTA